MSYLGHRVNQVEPFSIERDKWNWWSTLNTIFSVVNTEGRPSNSRHEFKRDRTMCSIFVNYFGHISQHNWWESRSTYIQVGHSVGFLCIMYGWGVFAWGLFTSTTWFRSSRWLLSSLNDLFYSTLPLYFQCYFISCSLYFLYFKCNNSKVYTFKKWWNKRKRNDMVLTPACDVRAPPSSHVRLSMRVRHDLTLFNWVMEVSGARNLSCEVL